MCEQVVCEQTGGRRRREAEAEGGGGIQNQKQEPHTKMWGIIAALTTASEHDARQRQHLRDEVGTWQRTAQNNGLSFL